MSENLNEQEEKFEDTGADTTDETSQDEDSEETDKVTLTAEEHREMTEKLSRYKAERDRLKSKTSTKKDAPDTSLIEKGFLNSAGYTDANDQAEVQKLAKNMGLDLDEAVNDSFIKERISSLQEARKVADALPTKKKRGSTTKDEVTYWINKGELPPKENVQLRRDVVNARYSSLKSKNKFNN